MTQNNLNPVSDPEQWLTEIYEEEYTGLMFFIVGIIKNEYEAEDVLGQSFSKLINKVKNTPAGEFHARANVKAYLVAIIKNDCSTWLNKKKSEKKRAEELAYLTKATDDNQLVFDLEKRDYLLKLQSMIAKLPDQLRQVAHLSWVECCTLEEMAQRMKLNKATLSVYKSRARNELEHMVLQQKDKLSPREVFLMLSWLHAFAGLS